jgi:formylglycine-generating enzyme required for sulfatase activity
MMLPQHFVTLPSFHISRFEVTQEQWRAIAGLPQVKINLPAKPSSVSGDRLPVDQVSWEEAMEFCARLSHESRRVYRLPTEAEWEYACRAGTTTPFYFGNALSPDLANYVAPESEGHDSLAGSRPMLVGSRGFPNAFGLYDMHGNVQEWCLDHWHDNYQGAPVDGSSWEADGNPKYRVVRGGSWRVASQLCRSGQRDRSAVTAHEPGTGFRVVLSP